GSRSRIASFPNSSRVVTPTLERVLKERVTGLVGADLELVEAEIRRELGSPVALIQEMGGYIAGAGGKRLRPILLLLSARLAGYRGPRSIRLACVVELLHTATLIHDDVVDQAPLRRGRPSVNAQWGDDASVLVGDHLYSKSFASLVRDNDPRVMETLARATASEAERVRQLLRRRTLPPDEIEEIRQLVIQHDGVDYALARAHAYAQAAKQDLEVFSPSEERETLGLIADFVVDRDR